MADDRKESGGGSLSVKALIRKDLDDIHYSGVESVRTLAAALGMPEEKIVKVNANENAYGTPHCVQQALIQSLAKDTAVYPDPLQSDLRQALATTLHPKLGVENICAGAGSDDLLDILIRLVLPKDVVISTPTFGMYAFLSRLSHARIHDVPRRRHDFSLPTDDLIQMIRKTQASLVFLPSPNNPTGTYLPLADVKKICLEKCILVLDEAYIDFTEKSSGDELLSELDNLVIMRTFSKWAGLAGLRVGYALAHASLIERMLAIKQPYNVNAAANIAAIAAIENREEIMKTVEAMKKEKDRLYEALQKFSWLRPVPSEANFVLCEVLDRDAKAVFEALRAQGILLRYFGAQGGALSNFIRISAGRPQDTDRVLSALQSLPKEKSPLEKEFCQMLKEYGPLDALLFDMDGVLVDVSQSYRQAIIQTGLQFGVSITAEEIAKAKMEGNANNDWILTHRLICQGLQKKIQDTTTMAQNFPSLEKVTQIFESLYQGTEKEGKDGLWRTESILVRPGLLQKLSTRFLLGIVTGRPRSPDANRFLRQYQIDSFFSSMVCMKETPAKPDPAPVRLAISQLKKKTVRALLVGDTVDDMKAATAAGILAIGVLPPHTPQTFKIQEEKALLKAGASMVISQGLLELLLCIESTE